MSKTHLRDLLTNLQKYVKINVFLKELNINQSNYSHFIHGCNYCMNVDDLQKLYNSICERLIEIVA